MEPLTLFCYLASILAVLAATALHRRQVSTPRFGSIAATGLSFTLFVALTVRCPSEEIEHRVASVMYFLVIPFLVVRESVASGGPDRTLWSKLRWAPEVSFLLLIPYLMSFVACARSP